MVKNTKKAQRKQLDKKPLDGAQKTSAAKPSPKVSKAKEAKQEASKREEELIESGNAEEMLKEVTKKPKQVVATKKQKLEQKPEKNVSKMSERKFTGDSSDSEEDEEAVYQKLFPKKISMETEHKEEKDEEDEEDLGFGKPLKLVIPKKTEAAKKAAAQRIAEMKSEAKVIPTSSVIYLGHIPHGFYERQLRAFFSQFGKVKRLRISRSHKTGKSRGYGFMEFEDPFVASIAAETMDNHRAFGRTLCCKVVPKDKQDERMWLGAKFNHKKYNLQNFRMKMRKLYNSKMNDEKYLEKIQGLLNGEEKLREKIKAAGIDYDFPGYAADVKAKGIQLKATPAAPKAE